MTTNASELDNIHLERLQERLTRKEWEAVYLDKEIASIKRRIAYLKRQSKAREAGHATE